MVKRCSAQSPPRSFLASLLGLGGSSLMPPILRRAKSPSFLPAYPCACGGLVVSSFALRSAVVRCPIFVAKSDGDLILLPAGDKKRATIFYWGGRCRPFFGYVACGRVGVRVIAFGRATGIRRLRAGSPAGGCNRLRAGNGGRGTVYRGIVY